MGEEGPKIGLNRGLADDGKRNGVQRNGDGRFVFARERQHLPTLYIYIHISLKGGVRGGKNHRPPDSTEGLADFLGTLSSDRNSCIFPYGIF